MRVSYLVVGFPALLSFYLGGRVNPWALLIGAGALLYVLPSMIAFSRQVHNAGSVYVINLLLGWTIWGWVASLAMAVKSQPVGMRNSSKVYGSPVGLVETRARSIPGGVSSGPAVSPADSDLSTLDRWLRDRT